MQGIQLTFFVHENQRIHHQLAWEWLLEKARTMGIHGGSAFRAIAGFGRHGVLHENHFFELAGDLPVSVTFILTPEQAEAIIRAVEAEEGGLFHVRSTVEFGLTGKPGA